MVGPSEVSPPARSRSPAQAALSPLVDLPRTLGVSPCLLLLGWFARVGARPAVKKDAQAMLSFVASL